MSPRALLAAAVLAGGCAGPGPAGDGLGVGSLEFARFGDARALSTDASGRLYVIDASSLVVLDTLGARLPGALHGAGLDRLSDVVDIDATNGLEWFVADAAGGRILRLSHDGRLLEDTPLPADVPAGGAVPALGGARGRPAAVAAGPGGVLYAAEASRGNVLRWDDSARRRVRVVGGADAGAGAVAQPVALASAPDGSLAVADSRRGQALVFDAFGSFRHAVAGPGGVRSVAWTTRAGAPALLVTGPRAVAAFTAGGASLSVAAYDLGREELVDAVETRGARWLLTPTRLLRVAR